MDRLEKQMSFILEIDKLKHIIRRNLLSDASRRENDAEHSWHLAMMVLLLKDHSRFPDIDMLKCVKMSLVHDLVEIYAGDSFLYSQAENESKVERENAAADKLFSLLPEDQALEIRSLWDEFEAGETDESKYVKSIDRLQPVLLNHKSGGKMWRDNKVSPEQVMNLVPPIVEIACPDLAEYARKLIVDARERGFF